MFGFRVRQLRCVGMLSKGDVPMVLVSISFFLGLIWWAIWAGVGWFYASEVVEWVYKKEKVGQGETWGCIVQLQRR